LPVNPFVISLNDANLTDGNVSEANPVNILENNATYYFARAKSSQYLYDDVTTNSVDTPISVVVYDDPGSPSDRNLTLFLPTEEFDWYLSTPHLSANNDGNITLIATGGTVGNANPVTIVNGINNPVVTVTNGGGTPNIVDIDFTNATSTWLIYNEYNNSVPSPFYRVRFIGTGGWIGYGETGNVVESNASKYRDRSLGW
jgi:hypothetical protein